jgi:cyclase
MKEKKHHPTAATLKSTAFSFFMLFLWPGFVSAQTRPIPQVPAMPFDRIGIITTKLTPRFYALTGSPNTDPGHPEAAGGRIGVLVGQHGVFLVDCSYAPLYPKIVEAIGKLTHGPVRFLVNTHEHPDHTGGNPLFVRQGALLISRQETRDALAAPLPPAVAAAIGQAALTDDPDRLPVLTYDGRSTVRFYFDGETIDLIPVNTAHTNGDTMVEFEQEDVIMIGDFYRNYGYPFVDQTHGGSFKGVVAAIDTLLKIAGPKTLLVPGHGNVIDRNALIPYRDMILDVRDHVLTLIAAGKSKQEVLASKLTAPYDNGVPGGTALLPAGLGTSADRFVSALYDECKKQTL